MVLTRKDFIAETEIKALPGIAITASDQKPLFSFLGFFFLLFLLTGWLFHLVVVVEVSADGCIEEAKHVQTHRQPTRVKNEGKIKNKKKNKRLVLQVLCRGSKVLYRVLCR